MYKFYNTIWSGKSIKISTKFDPEYFNVLKDSLFFPDICFRNYGLHITHAQRHCSKIVLIKCTKKEINI